MNSLTFFTVIKKRNKKVKFYDFLKMNWFSFSIGQFSPARSGELTISYLLKKKYKIPLAKSFACFLSYKISVLLSLLLFASVALILYFRFLYMWYIFIIIFFVIIFLSILLISNKKIRSFIKKYIFRKYSYLVKGFYNELKSIIKKPKNYIYMILLNSFKLALDAVVIILVLMILGIKVPLLLVMGINSISLMASFIPVSFSGIGIKESVVVLLFSYIGYNATIIATTYIMITAVYLILNFLAFIWFFNTKD